MMRRAALALVLLASRVLAAQQPDVSFGDDFQAYNLQAQPVGWVGPFTTWPDPTSPANMVFGHRDANTEAGVFTVLSTFAFGSPFEYRGRLLRTHADARLGLVFFSAQPDHAAYYVIDLEDSGGKRRSVRSQASSLTMRLRASGGGTPAGTVDSEVTPEPGRWYDFVVAADDFDNATHIRARFWPSGTPEPAQWQIDARDDGIRRLNAGRIALWSAVHGDAYFDDLSAKSWRTHEAPPEIHFFDSDTQAELDPAALALFRRPARIEVRVSDGQTAEVRLDGVPYSGAAIASDGLHDVTAQARFASASLRILVDQLAPRISLQANGSSFEPDHVFDRDVLLSAQVSDVSEVRVTSSIGVLPASVAQETRHSVTVTAVDQVGWEATATAAFTVDKTPPAVTIIGNGAPFLGGQTFSRDVVISWLVDDATLDKVEATLDGQPIQAGATVSSAAAHEVVVTAADRAGHVTRASRQFVLRKDAPEVRLLANGQPLLEKTYGVSVAITAEIVDSTATTHAATIDGSPYTLGSAVSEGRHTFGITVRNAAGLETTLGPVSFAVDLTPPTLAVTEAGVPFTDGLEFNRDVVPVLAAQDNLTAAPALTLIVDGREHSLAMPVTEERAEHVLTAVAADEAGHVTTLGPIRFMLDKTRPIVTIVEPSLPLYSRPVQVRVVVDDLTPASLSATLDGAPLDLAAPIAMDGVHELVVVATDAVGWQSDAAAASFTIDTAAPAIRFSTPAPDAVVGSPVVEIIGFADDAVSITINGIPAQIDTVNKVFAVRDVRLVEGLNEVTSEAIDRAGNRATALHRIRLDTRAPQVTVVLPAPNACFDAGSVEVRGTVDDPALDRVTVNGSAATVANGVFSASVPLAAEGAIELKIEAVDSAGHVSTVSLPIVVDRTAPVIDVLEGGLPFDAALLNRPVALFVRVTDAGRATAATTLNGTGYVPGSLIADERNHELKVVATDCAGHESVKTVSFEIDRTAPAILTLVPESGSALGTKPQITGTATADAETIRILPDGPPRAVSGGAFTIADAPLAEGVNELRLLLADRAGNATEQAYVLTLDLTPPAVEIVENGAPIAPDALFAREVVPIVRATENEAGIVATLNGAAFSSGTPIGASGAYTLRATATDRSGHVSEPAQATFTIDRAAPEITITAPANGIRVDTSPVEVRGTIVGDDIVEVSVNGIPATAAAGTFTAAVPLEAGPNVLLATALDRAGNLGAHQIDVVMGGEPVGIVLTAPYEGMVTNRKTTVVSGQILTSRDGARVAINGTSVSVDPAGFFRKTDFALQEGENVIVAAVSTAEGDANQVSVRVTSDLTPPHLRLLESGQPLVDGTRFAERAVVVVESGDAAAQLFVDGDEESSPVTIDEEGGHTILATARDAAGNEARVERSIFVGASGAGTCRFENIDPPNGGVVTSAVVTVSGRSGGAAAVRVNGTPALVSNGSFCATIELPLEGDNAVSFVCVDGSGNATGDSHALVLRRSTGEPSLTIDAPSEGAVSTAETIRVAGTAAGAATVEVNGSLVPLVAGNWSAPQVRLAAGLNVIVARALSPGGRTVSASRRVLYLKDQPALTITSPLPGAVTGLSRIDVSGGWSHLDPATITVNGVAAQVRSFSDTGGTFISTDVPLQPGPNTVTVTARDAAGRVATAATAVTLTSGFPAVSITEPADNHVVGVNGGESFTVRGTFSAPPGSTIDVAGEPATVDGNVFSATVRYSQGRTTPVLARVTTVDGATAADAIRVTKLGARPTVRDHFPAADAVEAGAGTMPLIAFSLPMDVVSTGAAFRLENSAGSPVSGTTRLDGDVLTFAPAALLGHGERYTMRLADTAKSIGGDSLEAPFAASFTVAASASIAAPTLAPITASCSQTVTISGTAAPGSRLRIDLGSLSFTATTNAIGAWSFPLPVAGSSGYHVVRVRSVGTDGSLSPAAESCFLVDCARLQVVGAVFDRAANRLAITFSRPVLASTVTPDAVLLRLGDGRIVGGTITVADSVVTVTPSEDLSRLSFDLEVRTSITDAAGTPMAAPFAERFLYEADRPPVSGDGSGFVSGEVFDASTGRPLGGASVFFDAVTSPLLTDSRGRYAATLGEGAHTIRISADGYTSAWRQVVVPAGAGVIPIDVRITPITAPAARTASAQVLAESTPVDGQSLPGLLPPGWSPLGAAVATTTGQLEFAVPAADIIQAAQVLTVVRYESDRDEWRVISAAANLIDGKVIVPVDHPGTFAVVYPDSAPGLRHPPIPTTGAVLAGVADPCATQTCGPLQAQSFVLDPPVILPTGRALATLSVDGTSTHLFPSGTAVQAYIEEELRLADGRRATDPPFTTDLLLYRNLPGTVAVAQFALAPSARAAQVVLDVGFNDVRILPYPGRIDRGTLIGTEGGRVPGDGRVTVDVPAGAAPEPLRTSSATVEDVAAFGDIPGFSVVAGFKLTLQLVRSISQPEGLAVAPPELLESARVTFPNVSAGQYVLVEVRDSRFRLVSQVEILGGSLATTKRIDRAVLPLDGVVREGTYLLLRAVSPIAFATGIARGPGGVFLRDVVVTASPLGVTDTTRVTGTYCIPVLAAPAAPFRLVPSTALVGNGAPYVHDSAPAPDSVVRVDLTLQAQPPRLVTTEPSPDAAGVTLTAFVKATFDTDLDAASISASSISVVDSTTGQSVAADVVLETSRTVLWRLRGGENRLTPNRTYTVTVAPTIRGVNGAVYGRTHVFRFSTVTQVVSGEIHPAKIRITIPDAAGHSRVIGGALALPAGFIALVTRRDREFSSPFQVTAGVDGTFSIEIDDVVSLEDEIDLQVLNSARAVAAIIPLTPFATEDGRGFIAFASGDTRFVTVDGIGVTVPEGAFAGPTLVTVSAAQQAPFSGVPGFDRELSYAGGVALDFDGVAQKRLEVEIPLPANADPARSYYLGYLGQSTRGPRVMIVDLLRIDGGRVTTIPAAVTPSGVSTAGAGDPGVTSVLIGSAARSFLLGVNRSGTYAAVSFNDPVAWAFIQGVSAGYELFFDTLTSIFAASYYMAERGSVLVPVAAGRPFTVIGASASSDVTLFTTAYDPLAAGDAAAATVIPSPIQNRVGPYPVFASPARVEIVDLTQRTLLDESIRNFVVNFDGNMAAITAGPEALPPETRVEVMNVSTSARVWTDDFSADARGLVLPAEKGDRLLLFVEEPYADPSGVISVVFDKPIHVPDQATLRSLFRLSFVDADGAARPVGDEVPIRAEAGNRRFVVALPGSLQLGRRYRLSLSREIRDDTTGAEPLKLAQRRGQPPLGDGIHFDFATRAPKGLVGTFALSTGGVRDLAMSENVLLVSGMEAGLIAYDASNPASLPDSIPLAIADPPPGPPEPDGSSGPGQTWAVAADQHGRVWATAVSNMFCMVRSYRVDDFIALAGTRDRVQFKSSAIVSWRPGINAGLPLSTSFITVSDRPEAIPRKMSVVTRDDESAVYDGLFPLGVEHGGVDLGPVGGGFTKLELTIPARSVYPYLRQRVTIVNQTARFRWSADVPRGGSAKVTVIGRQNDQFQVIRNQITYGVINLFGYGLGIFDLNAIESNAIVQGEPGYDPQYQKLSERVLITPGDENAACLRASAEVSPCDPASAAAAGVHCPIKDLTFSPESRLAAGVGSELVAWALDANRGVLDLRVEPPRLVEDEIVPATCSRDHSLVLAERVLVGGEFKWFGHPRLNVLRRLYRARTAPSSLAPAAAPPPALRDPVARFTSIATLNRGTKSYGLIAGFQYGVLVVKLDPASQLSDASLVDVIWIPAGAASVRVLDGQSLATVVDGKGRVLLVDLNKIDESGAVAALETPDCTAIDCEWPLFPTVAAALGPGAANAGPGEIGSDDPRIVWKSEPGLVRGTLPPLVDSETGFVFTGDVDGRTMRVLSAVDPRLRVIAEPREAGGIELRSIVPLGVEDPSQRNLAAFRVEVSLPGSIAESLPGGQFPIRVESERVAGGRVADALPGWPPVHLTGVALSRVVPSSADVVVKRLRYQRGWNRFVSPPIVALADPRASDKYQWLADVNRAAEGCRACARPETLRNDPAVREVFAGGRFFVVYPEPDALAGTPWAYLAERGRLWARLATVPADTARATRNQIAGQDPPIADGLIQETVFVHSGEVMSKAVDLDAGGRAGANVVVDRTYLSRTIGATPFGYGWTSSLFERLRGLPDGNVEYRDGAGEVWTFTLANGSYHAPKGLFLKLTREEREWKLEDQHANVTRFDRLGRLRLRADNFANPAESHSSVGNVVEFLYDPNGRLSRIVDPVGRSTVLRYTAEDLVSEIEDWRGRKVTYGYEAGRLVSVKGPETYSPSGFAGRPETRYAYQPVGGSLAELVDLAANLRTITDPAAAAPRVMFEYDLSLSAPVRDRVKQQTWATAETATFAVSAAVGQLPSEVTITDALGQTRIYQLTPAGSFDGRAHVQKVTMPDVRVFEGTASTARAALDVEGDIEAIVTEVLERNEHGQIARSRAPHGKEMAVQHEPAVTVGTRVREVVESLSTPLPLSVMKFVFDDGEGAKNNQIMLARSVAGGEFIERDSPVPSRSRKVLETVDEGVRAVRQLDDFGQLLRQSQDATENTSQTNVVDYVTYDATAPLIARGRVRSLKRPGDAQSLLFTYASGPAGGDRTTVTDAVRGTITTIDRDAGGRPIRRVVSAAGGTVLADERFGYDANGQLIFSSHQQDGLGEVETRTVYDAMLRPTSVSTTHASVNGVLSTLVATTSWDLANRTIRRTDPHVGSAPAATEITTLDALGRPSEVRRQSPSGAEQTLRVFRYDRQGLLSYESNRTSSAVIRVHDALGRETLSIDSMGQRHESSWTAWDEPEVERRLDGGLLTTANATSVVGQLKRVFTRGGRLRAVNEELIAGSQFRSTRYDWSDGGRQTSMRTGPVAGLDANIERGTLVRLAESHFDSAGRLTDEKAGEGSGFNGSFTEHGTYAHASSLYDGMLPLTQTAREPRAGASFATTFAYDGLGRPVNTSGPDGFTTDQAFDQAGNVRSMLTSGHSAPSTGTYDSRGLITEAGRPDRTAIRYRYDALGNLIEYRDETGEATSYETDGLGRVVRVKYPDSTCEATVFENGSGRVAATRDRAGQWLVYRYNGYLLGALHLGRVDTGADCTRELPLAAPEAGAVFVDYLYDAANRLERVRSASAAVEWDEFDYAGRPHVTRSIRYANASGFAAPPVILDVHSQKHVWSIYDGERERYRMPVAGRTVSDTASASPWHGWIREQRDAVGNVVGQASVRADSEQQISRSIARGAGRLSLRERSLTSAGPLRTLYGYAEPLAAPTSPELPVVPPAPGPHSGLLGSAAFVAGGSTLSGSTATRDAARRIGRQEFLGLAGRESRFAYDDRDRLTLSILGATAGADRPVVDDILDPGDFRTNRNVGRLSESERAVLGAQAPLAELPSFTATSAPAHQIGGLTFPGDVPADVTFAFQGGRRSSDGIWSYEYDALGRLVRLTRTVAQADLPARYEYEYDPLNRLVGRRVCTNTDRSPCALETRTNVLARDGLPADTTFVWDVVSDRLAAVFEAGKSEGASEEYPGLVRQYVHGDRAYDDPIVVLSREEGAVRTYLPVVDEAGTGNLLAVLNQDGTLAERALYGDAYGASPRFLTGPVVQSITRKVTRDQQGAIIAVVFRVSLSDAVNAASLRAGASLRAVTPTGTLAMVSPVTAEIDPADPYAFTFTLSANDWNALTSAPSASDIELVVGSALRAEGWGSASVSPVPDWLLTLQSARSTPAEPLVQRSSIASATTSTAEVTLWHVSDLYLVATAESKTKLLTGFKAAPFIEPATGLVYLRERWQDLSTGTWLTPDPLFYKDSSNLYAFCGGDPVNCSDPTGEDGYDDKQAAYIKWYGAQIDAIWQKRKGLAEQIRQQRRVTSDTGLLEADDRILAEQLMAFGGTPDNAVTFFEAARARGDASVLSMSFEDIHTAVVADEGVRNVGTAVISAFGPHLAQMEGIKWDGAWRRAKQFVSNAIDAYNQSWVSSEVGAIGPGVVNKPKGTDPFRIVPSKHRPIVRRAFGGVAAAETLSDDLIVYRRFGGGASATGSPWFSAREYAKAGNARRYRALPDVNTAEYEAVFVIPAGTTILRGRAASMVGKLGFSDAAVGGGVQIYVPDPSVVRRIP